ncbi:MAG: DUF11 domain-containing protein [Clostridia bacterium]|nr:DUF11 domain-containing protein [Clostridia bacterium]
MFKTKMTKIIIAVTCILAIISPYAAPAFAVLKDTDATVKIDILSDHGGKEASGELTDEEKGQYDYSPRKYTINGDVVYKLIEYDDGNWENELFCLDATKTFPGLTTDYQEYENKGSLFDSTNDSVKKLKMGSTDSNSAEWKKNYAALNWLIKNIYLPTQDPSSQKNIFLSNAFKNYQDEKLNGKTEEEKISIVRTYLNDADIDVTQQEAIWHFTNADSSKYSSINTIERDAGFEEAKEVEFRDRLMKHLYDYLVSKALANEEQAAKTVPSFDTTNPKASIDDNYYIAGPFKVNPGQYSSSEYTVKVLDQDAKEISNYKIKIKDEEDFTSKPLNEVATSEFSVYIPKSNSKVNVVRVELRYDTFETKATIFKNKRDNEDSPVYQPVVLITKNPESHTAGLEVELDKQVFDLAVRQYIIKVNGQEQDRAPNPDYTDLKNGDSSSGIYRHAKTPLKIKAGDIVTFEIRVYNEGDIPAKNVKVAFSIPTGFEYIEDDETNQKYEWHLAENGDGTNRDLYITEYLKDELPGFDKKNDNVPPSEFVQIVCRVSDNVVSSKILTPVSEVADAESTVEGHNDRDSNALNNDYVKNDLDASNYSGDINNKADLTDSNYYYKGRQDDDDFEKVEVENPEKPAFDMNLKKFVSGKKGSSELSSSREPKVNVTPLKNGKTDAEYTIPKSGIQAKVGDIITYTFRVYNEGQVDGYAEEVADYLPEGLGYLLNYKANEDNYWQLPKDDTSIKTVKLSTIENAVQNVSKSDFTEEVSNLSDAQVVIGKVKLTSTKLKSNSTSNTNLIKGFDKENGTTLDYKDITITCVVLSTDNSNNNLRNIGEIIKTTDKDRNEIEDIDSTPNSVDPDNYPDSEKRQDGSRQDDNDYEELSPEAEKKQNFDLALKKFITGVNDTKITDRMPTVTKGTNGKPVITSQNKSVLKIANNDLLTYTIRVYNEGDTAGYAKTISDNIPVGLVFLTDNDINKKYGWKMYDKNGNETSDINQATVIKTDYLSLERSKARNENCLLTPYDAEKGTISYQDVQVVFKIDENKIDKSRGIANIAEISEDEDENGNSIRDVDSEPGNGKEGEDDLDKEQVYVKYFDLSLQKYLSKIIITENGQTREIDVKASDGLQKVEIHRKRINVAVVKFVYTIVVKNEGEIAGYADEIIDYIPEGLEFIAEDNKGWTKITDKAASTDALVKTLLEPGQTASVQITLKWKNGENNFGVRDNIAEISKASNPNGAKDIDSTPGNFAAGEDDQDNAQVMISISTGNAPTYILLAVSVIAIISTGAIMIKKYVL